MGGGLDGKRAAGLNISSRIGARCHHHMVRTRPSKHGANDTNGNFHGLYRLPHPDQICFQSPRFTLVHRVPSRQLNFS